MKKFFKHSPKDIWPVAILVFQFLVWIKIYRTYQAGDWFILIFLGIFQSFLTVTNYQCVAHNFIHNPFFKSEQLNKLFSILNSLGLLFPETIYKHHHMNHHRYNNDRKDEYGKTKDHSSLYRYSKTEAPEPLLSYAILGVIRSPVDVLVKQALKSGEGILMGLETLFLLALLFLVGDIGFILFVIFPIFYAGQALALAENYFEHYGAKGTSRKNDSVSCYSPFYNLIWFNNGYHQEHHLSPQTHWTRMAEITPMLDENHHQVKGAHFFNF